MEINIADLKYIQKQKIYGHGRARSQTFPRSYKNLDDHYVRNQGTDGSLTMIVYGMVHLGHYWLKISFSSPARMEFCPRFNLVIMPLYATTHVQI